MKKALTTLIVLLLGYVLVQSIYTEMTKDKTPGKAKRLECQKRATTFERAFDTEAIVAAQKQVRSEKINFTSHTEPAIYMESVLFDFISLEQTDAVIQKAFDGYFAQDATLAQKYNFSYYIYENDKKDPGKKGKKSKLYTGYVVFEVKNTNNKVIYKIQADFMDDKAADISQSLQCVVDSFMTYNLALQNTH